MRASQVRARSAELERAQEALSATKTRQAGSWSFEAPPGAYGAVRAWHGAGGWVDAIAAALSTPQGDLERRRARVARDTLLRVARADAACADAATGRGLATAHETVAAALGMSSKTVQRARALLELLGFAVTIVEGRYLTVDERAAATAAHGGRQLRAASLRALTLPVQNVHLPRQGSGSSSSLVRENSPRRASAREASASRPPARTRRTRRTRQDGSCRQPRPLDVQRFAAQLVTRLPWLARGRHIGHVCSMLERAAIEPSRWSVPALLDVLEATNRREGVYVPDPGAQRDPVAYLAWSIRRAVDPAEPTPLELERARRAELRAAALARAAELQPVAGGELEEPPALEPLPRRPSTSARQPYVPALQQRRAPIPAVSSSTPSARIAAALLGGRSVHEFDLEAQARHTFAQRLGGLLTWRGWTLDRELVDVELISWTWEPSRVDERDSARAPVTMATLDVHRMTVDVVRAGELVAHLAGADWRRLEVELEQLELHRSPLR